jgi:hypothetical protein
MRRGRSGLAMKSRPNATASASPRSSNSSASAGLYPPAAISRVSLP